MPGITKSLTALLSVAVVAVKAATNSTIPTAEIVSKVSHIVPGPLLITEYFFKVPLDYDDPEGETITLMGRTANAYSVPIVSASSSDSEEEEEDAGLPYIVFLAGGPGFGNPSPENAPLTATAMEKGYQPLFLDHRGTGLSTPVSLRMLKQVTDDDEDAMVDYLRLMRQDNTVRDCEAVRKALKQDKWSIFGQSYGGFVALSYLSLHPEGLREVFLTGGLAPVGRTAQEVYESLYPRVMKRNKAYYKKFPEDVANIREIAEYIESEGGAIPLPAGGSLTVARLMCIGIDFGGAGGFDSVHAIISNLKTALDQFGFFTRASLTPLESFTTFDNNIIYAILHEAIYTNGPGDVSAWASDRVARERNYFTWLSSNATTALPADESEPILFAGENIFPFMFDTYPELIPLKGVANKLAAIDDWTPIYDEEVLEKNTVPIYAASYIDDLYVDYEYAKDTAELTGAKTWETNAYQHSGLRSDTTAVLTALWNLRDNVFD